MKLVIHPTATADIRIPAAHIVVSLRADGMYEIEVNVDPEIEVFDPEIEVFDPEVEVFDPEIEVDVDDTEHWFSYGCDCEWCERMRDALDNYIDNAPWSCPRCESINNGSAVCEICDTDIRVDRMG